MTSKLLCLPGSSDSRHTQLTESCCLPPDYGGRVRAAQTSNQCHTPDISSHRSTHWEQLGEHTAWSPGGKSMLTPIPFTNPGAKWGTWPMVCVLALSEALPSSAMTLGSRHIRSLRTSWETSLKTDLEGAEASHTPVRTLSCRGHRGLFLFDYHPRVPRRAQVIEGSGGMDAQGRRRR